MCGHDKGWQSFFGADPYPFNLDMVAAREDTAREVGFLSKHLAPECSLLDAGCGWGRHAGPLAQAGYSVVAMDALSSNARIAAHRYPSVAVVCGDVNCLPFSSASFDAAISLY